MPYFVAFLKLKCSACSEFSVAQPFVDLLLNFATVGKGVSCLQIGLLRCASKYVCNSWSTAELLLSCGISDVNATQFMNHVSDVGSELV